tara:strand:- start:726 stop:905 length:180 start_codon:yes stop_codon:yes gene_type:complete
MSTLEKLDAMLATLRTEREQRKAREYPGRKNAMVDSVLRVVHLSRDEAARKLETQLLAK